MIMHAKVYLILWTLEVLIDSGGYCIDKHECLTWEINSNLLTLICRLKHFSEPVILIDNHEQEYVRCSVTDATCFPRHKSKNISIDSTTNTVIFTIEDIDKNNVDGKWKCKQGKTIFETGVSLSKGIINATYLHISGEILNAEIDSKVVKLTCHSCREPRKNNIEFLINGSSIDSISYNKNTGHCIHKNGNCKPQDCSCHPSGNEFTRLFQVSNVNATFSCYTSFLDNDRKSIFSLSVTTLFDGKVFLEIASDTKIIKPPANKFDDDKRNKTASLNTTNIKGSGKDSKRAELPVIWIIVGVSIIVALVPTVILLTIFVRRIIIPKKGRNNSKEELPITNKLLLTCDLDKRSTDVISDDEYTSGAEKKPLLPSEDTSCCNEPYNNPTSVEKVGAKDKKQFAKFEIKKDVDKSFPNVLEPSVNAGKVCKKTDEPTKCEDCSFVITNETTKSDAKPLVKTNENTANDDKLFDKTDYTLQSDDKPFDKTDKTLRSEDKHFDKTNEIIKSEDAVFEKKDKTTKSEDKPYIKTNVENARSKDKPLYKTDEPTKSEDISFVTLKSENKPIIKSNETTENEDESFNNTDDTFKSKYKPFETRNETTKSEYNPIDNTDKTTQRLVKPFNKTEKTTKREDKQFNKTDETLKSEGELLNKTDYTTKHKDQQFDKTDQTKKTEGKILKTDETTKSKDKQFDKAEETPKIEDKILNKTNKNSKIEDKQFKRKDEITESAGRLLNTTEKNHKE